MDPAVPGNHGSSVTGAPRWLVRSDRCGGDLRVLGELVGYVIALKKTPKTEKKEENHVTHKRLI